MPLEHGGQLIRSPGADVAVAAGHDLQPRVTVAVRRAAGLGVVALVGFDAIAVAVQRFQVEAVGHGEIGSQVGHGLRCRD